MESHCHAARRKRRGWRIAAAAGVLVSALAARHWFDRKPVETFAVEVPADARFRYSRWVSLTADDKGWITVDVPPETGHSMLNLIAGSERYVPDEEWRVHFGWPPVYKTVPMLESLSPWYALEVVAPDSGASELRVDFVNESRFLTTDGKHLVPTGNRPELRRLMDALDEQCYAAYELQLIESPVSRDEADRDDSPDNPGEEQPASWKPH